MFLDRPSVIEDEMFRLSTEALGSEQDANFVMKELLPVLSTDRVDQALQIILENYQKFKKEENHKRQQIISKFIWYRYKIKI